jgi:ATP-binding cassette subfamily B protein
MNKDKKTIKTSMWAGMNVIGRIVRMAFEHPWRMGLALGASVIAVIFHLTVPQFLGSAVDSAHSLLGGTGNADEARAALLRAGILLLGANFLRGAFTMLHNYEAESVGQLIGYKLRLAVYNKIQRLSFGYHDRIHSGDLITRGMLDVEGVRLFVNTGIIRLVVLSLMIGTSTYLMLSTDLLLGAVALSFVPFVGWRAIVTRLKLREGWHRLQERLSVLTRVMEENLGGIRVVRAFSAQDHEMEKFDTASNRAERLTRHRIGLRVRNGTVMTFFYFISMGLVLLVGGQKTLAGELTVGQLTEFLAYLTILQMPVRRLGLLVNSFARSTTSGERLFSVLDVEPEIKNKDGALDLEKPEGILRFEGVGFAYEMEDGKAHALSDINFEVRPGQTLGIVGPPGAGKSTIAHLIPRFYDVSSGRITIDGRDIRDLSLKTLRGAIGIIQQDSFIFTSRIENNVAYGNPWADRDKIVWASEIAQLHSYIDQLPKQYKTMVGERGVSLSGGQRQRLAIARTLVTTPPILIFDDSTAAIDAATEQRIRSELSKIAANHTTIIIAHRLSSLMHADEILFVDNGRIIERGSHDALIKKNGRYKALYDLQSNPADKEHLEK